MDGDAFRWEVDRLLEQAMLESGGLLEYLSAVVLVAAGAIGVAGSYSLVTTSSGGGTTAATSGGDALPPAPAFETGPAAAALRAGGRAQLDDLTQDRPVPDHRSPGWPLAAVGSGFRSATCAVAGSGADERLVALTAYSPVVGAFAGPPGDRTALFVAEVARTMPRALRLFEQAAAIRDLQAALASRSVIDKALGVVMARRGCSSEAAFADLRRTSQNSNVKLRTLAAQILEGYPGATTASPPLSLRSA